MEKKVGIITFHAAHNYGSCLQAYAIKRTYENLGAECEIINFRTPAQKDQYTPLTKRKGIKYILKNAFFLLTYSARKRKYLNFENFISEYLLSGQREYNSLDELMTEPPLYDLYVCGSDQIWNTAPNDASMAYFLPFASGRKVSYAPSFGQLGEIEHKEEITNYLKSFDLLSVREERGKELVKEMTGLDVEILVDPTMLLDKSEWDSLVSDRKIKEDYIFFYSLFSTKEMIKEVRAIASALHLKVVVSNVSNQNDIFAGFTKQTDAGPREFLSLIKHAKLIITSSFHGSVFSIIYEKPFLAYGGMGDKRISTLLEKTGLEECAIRSGEGIYKLKNIFSLDYTDASALLKSEKNKSIDYLKRTMEL